MAYSPGNDKISCPHCGKTIRAKKINKSFEVSNDNDILDMCGKCAKFIRKSHILSPGSENDGKNSGWPKDICWFCETQPAEDNRKAIVYLIKDPKEAPVGFGMTEHKAKLEMVSVPRCATCRNSQKWEKFLPWVTGPLLLILGCVLTFFLIESTGNKSVALLVLPLTLVSLVLVPLGILRVKFSGHPRIKGIYFKKYYPDVKKLEEGGWQAQADCQIS
jgi:hypothetical protein